MSRKNKFGFDALETKSITPKRERSSGPMSRAVQDAAESLTGATEAKVEARRINAQDAKAYRAAQEEGLVLQRIELFAIETSDLPRDRLSLEEVAVSDEMEELKTSIRNRGQKEPIEVFQAPSGMYQLKKGWRRFTALSQLYKETGDERFATVLARVEQGDHDWDARYIDMVEENIIREDLSFAEMAQLALTAARDDRIKETDPNELVSRFYGALHKTKRSYIRSFVFLLSVLGDSLPFAEAIPRNLGVDVSRAIRSAEEVEALKRELSECRSPEQQNALLTRFLAEKKEAPAKGNKAKPAPKQKFEFFVGQTKVTARQGELRVVSARDFASVPKGTLEEAVQAFEAVLAAGPRIR